MGRLGPKQLPFFKMTSHIHFLANSPRTDPTRMPLFLLFIIFISLYIYIHKYMRRLCQSSKTRNLLFFCFFHFHILLLIETAGFLYIYAFFYFIECTQKRYIKNTRLSQFFELFFSNFISFFFLLHVAEKGNKFQLTGLGRPKRCIDAGS
jgi:hypothetical protein